MQDFSVAKVTRSPVQFTGKGMEYFSIWLVNIALSIITLGIYSAWAKVRTQQYFYGNTKILGQSFQYLATGGQILKGRLIAVFAFIIYQVLVALSPYAAMVVALVFLAAMPWLINSGLRFNARMSSWRNVRFDFNGSYWRAFMVYFVWPWIGILTLGILMPRAVHRAAQYVVTSHSYGQENFEFTALPAHYGRVIWGLMIIYLLLIILLIVGFSQMNFALIGVGYFAIYLVSFAIKPLLFNLYWAHVKLKGNGFQANMGILKFAWIFFSNSLAVAFSLGLLYPWSQVRMARFTADSLKVLDVGSLGTIAAKEMERSNAIGEEMGEVFDVDVGFGV